MEDYEFMSYDTSEVYLESRWYAKYELEAILDHLISLNETNSKSMEQT